LSSRDDGSSSGDDGLYLGTTGCIRRWRIVVSGYSPSSRDTDRILETAVRRLGIQLAVSGYGPSPRDTDRRLERQTVVAGYGLLSGDGDPSSPDITRRRWIQPVAAGYGPSSGDTARRRERQTATIVSSSAKWPASIQASRPPSRGRTLVKPFS
jgi:hypothetical protein